MRLADLVDQQFTDHGDIAGGIGKIEPQVTAEHLFGRRNDRFLDITLHQVFICREPVIALELTAVTVVASLQ